VLILFYGIERAREILNSIYDLPREYVHILNQVFSRFTEVAGPSADVVRDTVSVPKNS
jgi:ABC-type sulfate transport system substrate-binding protein